MFEFAHVNTLCCIPQPSKFVGFYFFAAATNMDDAVCYFLNQCRCRAWSKYEGVTHLHRDRLFCLTAVQTGPCI